MQEGAMSFKQRAYLEKPGLTCLWLRCCSTRSERRGGAITSSPCVTTPARLRIALAGRWRSSAYYVVRSKTWAFLRQTMHMFLYDCYISLPIRTIQERSAISSTIIMMGLYFSRDTCRQHLLFFIGRWPHQRSPHIRLHLEID